MRATNCRDGLREAVAGKSSMRFGRRRSARSPSEAAEGRSDPIRGDPRLLGIELARHSFIAPPVRTLLSYGSTNCFCRAARADLRPIRSSWHVADARCGARQCVAAARLLRSVSVLACSRPAALAQQQLAQHETGPRGLVVRRACVRRGSRQSLWVPGGRARQTFSI